MTISSYDLPYPLTPLQVSSFEKDGFLLLQDVLDSDAASALQSWTSEVKGWPDRKGEHMPYLEKRSDGSMGICRTENYANFHPGFNSLFRGKRLTGILGELMGEPAVLFKEKINYKEAGGSGGFDAHIDANAYTHAGAISHLTFLMAVNDMDQSNGCLEVVPGSHKMTIPLASNKCIDPKWEKAHNWVPVPMKAGALLIFGSYLAHRSGPNSSPRPRNAIYATYNGISEGDKHDAYYAHRRELWPPTSERVEGKDYTEGAFLCNHYTTARAVLAPRSDWTSLTSVGSPMAGGKEAIHSKLSVSAPEESKPHDAREKKAIVDQLFSVIRAQGDADYIGENISQLEHSLQAAEAARSSGATHTTIAAALLHDIGHFIPFSQAKDMVQDGKVLGKASHDAVGEAYLKDLGFPKEVYELVGAHVQAKRYLTGKDAAYLSSLSEASIKSLKYQGGPFTPDQVAQFESDPLWREKVALRKWDDEAKREDWNAPGLDTFYGVVLSCL